MSVSGTPADASGNRLCVARAADVAIVQVFGLGNMLLAPTLQMFVESELNSGLDRFLVDLRHCQGMDSTFMGTFIGLAAKTKKAGGWFCLVNVSPANERLLKMLGVIHMVSIRPGDSPFFTGESSILSPSVDPYVRQKQIVRAHKLLIEANPDNEALFGDFVREVETELNQCLPTILPPPRTEDADGENGE